MVLGLDLGTKTLGVAINDPGTTFCHPLTTIRFKSSMVNTSLVVLKDIVKEHQVQVVALGYPLNMQGTESFMSRQVLAFKALLETELGLKVVLIDERLTSIMANKNLRAAEASLARRKECVDEVAACLILDTYLRSVNYEP
ncbi:MAG: Holliday junction resolvase RuvX [Erysipelotrichaceae bacterium]|nr:Holliday junction resolvase RuvX [Erysipelotrichaceae bacterium]